MTKLQTSALDALGMAAAMISFAFADQPGVMRAVQQIMQAGKSLGMTYEQAVKSAASLLASLDAADPGKGSAS